MKKIPKTILLFFLFLSTNLFLLFFLNYNRIQMEESYNSNGFNGIWHVASRSLGNDDRITDQSSLSNQLFIEQTDNEIMGTDYQNGDLILSKVSGDFFYHETPVNVMIFISLLIAISGYLYAILHKEVDHVMHLLGDSKNIIFGRNIRNLILIFLSTMIVVLMIDILMGKLILFSYFTTYLMIMILTVFAYVFSFCLQNKRRSQIHGNKCETLSVLDGVNLEMGEKSSIAIERQCSSEKWNLLNCILNNMCGVDVNTTEVYDFDEESINQSSSKKRKEFRQENIGIITQQFDLLGDRNVYENIALSLKRKKLTAKQKAALVDEALIYVGLKGIEKKSIKDLSEDEMQRIAIARAIIKKPKVIVADEPTRSLDIKTKNEILRLFHRMMKDGHQFIILTKDTSITTICDKRFLLQNDTLTKQS